MKIEITIGKEIATITRLIGDVVVIRYLGKEANVDIANGWKKLSGTLDEAEIAKVKRGAGKQLK